MEHTHDPAPRMRSQPPSSPISSMRSTTSTSRTPGRYAVGPDGPILNPDGYSNAPIGTRRRSETLERRLTEPAPSGMTCGFTPHLALSILFLPENSRDWLTWRRLWSLALP